MSFGRLYKTNLRARRKGNCRAQNSHSLSTTISQCCVASDQTQVLRKETLSFPQQCNCQWSREELLGAAEKGTVQGRQPTAHSTEQVTLGSSGSHCAGAEPAFVAPRALIRHLL